MYFQMCLVAVSKKDLLGTVPTIAVPILPVQIIPRKIALFLVGIDGYF